MRFVTPSESYNLQKVISLLLWSHVGLLAQNEMHLLHNKELTTTDDVLKHKTNEDELVTRLHSNRLNWEK
jgi:hypothetical protein